MYVFFFLINILFYYDSVEQVKGSEEMKEKIIAASKEARLQPDYPQELLPDYYNQNLCDKYINHFHNSPDHIHSNGMNSLFFVISIIICGL